MKTSKLTNQLALDDLKCEAFSECLHSSIPEPEFDLEVAKTLSADEVRKKYPRIWATCPDCGCPVIKYASFTHYIAGDW